MTATTPPRVKFLGGGEFSADVKTRVEKYISRPGVMRRAYVRLYAKAVFVITWAVVSYYMLLFHHHAWYGVVGYGLSFGLAMGAVEFNIMHDGNHGAFARNRWLNNAAGFALDIAGGCSKHWKQEHNISHHGYTNVDGFDEDLEAMPFARLADTQEWRPYFRYQQWYVWAIYGFGLLRWMTVGDILRAWGENAQDRSQQGSRMLKVAKFVWRYKTLFATKTFATGWMLALPLALNWSAYGAVVVLATFASVCYIVSELLFITFQLAHCVDETKFVSPADADENGKMPEHWAVGQVLATQDFCRNNPLLTWYLGGLNFQVVHHLFPKLPHTLYRELSHIVEQTCRDHGIRYVAQPSLWRAIRSHWRHLKEMGQQPVPQTA